MAQANEHSTSEDGEPPVVVDLVAVAKERTDQIHSESSDLSLITLCITF